MLQETKKVIGQFAANPKLFKGNERIFFKRKDGLRDRKFTAQSIKNIAIYGREVEIGYVPATNEMSADHLVSCEEITVQQGGVVPDPQPSNPMAHYYQSDGSHVRPRLDGTTTVYLVEQCNNFTVFWGKCSCSPGGLKQWDDGPEYHVGHDDYVRPCTPCTEGKPLVQR